MITKHKIVADYYDWKWHSKKGKSVKNFIVPIVLSVLILGVVGVIANSYISDKESIFDGNITANRINEVLYVQAGNATDLVSKVNEAISLNGVTVEVPIGTYNISSPLNVSNNTIIRGQGSGTVIRIVSEDSNVINMKGGYSRVENLRVYSSTSGYNGSAIYFDSSYPEIANWLYLNNLWITSGSGVQGNSKGVSFVDNQDSTVRGITWVNIRNLRIFGFKYGLYLETNNESAYIKGNTFDNIQCIESDYCLYQNMTLGNSGGIQGNTYNMRMNGGFSSVYFAHIEGDEEYIYSVVFDAGDFSSGKAYNITSKSNHARITDNLLTIDKIEDSGNDTVINFYNYQTFPDRVFVEDLNISGDFLTQYNYDDSKQGKVLSLNFNSINNANKSLDSSGFNNHASYTATSPTFTSTEGFNNGGAYNYDGTGQYLSVTNSNSLQFSNVSGMTVSAWIYPKTLTSNDGDIVSHFLGGVVNNRSFVLQIRENKAVFKAYFNGSTASAATETGTTTINQNSQWYFITGVWTGSELLIYLNGELDGAAGTSLGTLFYPDSSIILSIGQSDESQNFNGTIDEVQIWNRSLTANEIKNLYLQKVESEDSYVHQGQDINPITNILYNLGSSTLRWLKLWVKDIDASGNVNISGNTTFSQDLLASGRYYAEGVGGVNQTIRFKNASQTGNCTMVIKQGIITSATNCV